MKTAMQELRDNLNAMQIDGIIQLSPTEEEMITYMFNIALRVNIDLLNSKLRIFLRLTLEQLNVF
jgi:hypothetical protein